MTVADPEKANTPKQGAWRRITSAFGEPSALTMFCFGLGCGLPFLLLGYTLSIWLRKAGYDLGMIGLVSYISLMYTLKFLWAPFLDWKRAPLLASLGRRRSWLILAILMLMIGIAGMGTMGPNTSPWLFLGLMFIAAFAGATQDTVVDAYRIEIAPVESQAALAAVYTMGYRAGMMLGGAGALYLADAVSWKITYFAAAALFVIPLIAAWLAKEPQAPKELAANIKIAITGPFLEFFSRHNLKLGLLLLLFVGMFKLPDQMLGVVAGPFYVDTGYSLSDIATVSKLYGVWIGLAGAMIGGVAVLAIGLNRCMLIAAFGVALSNLAFLLMSIYPGELWAFFATISADNLFQGFAGTVLIAYMSGLANRSFSATQYALLSSLANLPGKLIGGLSGFFVEQWGYTAFFVFSSLSLIPTLALFYWILRLQKPAKVP